MTNLTTSSHAILHGRDGGAHLGKTPRSPAAPTDPTISAAFIEAMRGAVTGVNVVTTDGFAGRFGLTVSAFSSVSAEPPLVLVCLNQRSPACDAILANERFCVNVLSTEQQHLADTFSGQTTQGAAYDFNAGHWQDIATGAPVLVNAVASFDCALHSAIASGSHTILIGRAMAVSAGRRHPLLYTNRGYGQPCLWN